MIDSFKAYSAYYDLLYQSKDYPVEALYIHSLLKKYAKTPVFSILEVGSGTGKHANLLADLEFSVTGIEPSKEMLKIARENANDRVSFNEGAANNFKLNAKFDACISLFHVISYLTTNDELIASFTNVYNHLNANGIFIFDCWYGPAVLHQIPEKRSKLLKDDKFSIQRNATPKMYWNENIVDVLYEIQVTQQDAIPISFTEKHRMRYFSLPELQLLATFTGFKILHTEEFLTKKKPSENSWGVCLILQKI